MQDEHVEKVPAQEVHSAEHEGITAAVEDIPKPRAKKILAGQFLRKEIGGRQWFLTATILGAGLLAVGALGYLYFTVRQPLPRQAGGSAFQFKTSPNSTALAKFMAPTTGETWLSRPEKLSDQGFITSDSGAPVMYYKVGMRGVNTIILSQQSPVYDYLVLFEKSPQGVVRALEYPNASSIQTSNGMGQFKAYFVPSVQIDTTTHYDSLSPPATLSIGNNQNVTVSRTAYVSSDLGQMRLPDRTELGDVTTVRTFGGGTKLVRIEHHYVDTKLTTIHYALDLPIGSRLDLSYQPIPTDLTQYTWENGVAVVPATNDNLAADASTIHGIVRGCGSIGGSLSRADAVADSDFVPAGKTPDARTVYAFKDSSNTLVQKAYSEYQDYYRDTARPVTLDEFLKQHALIAYELPSKEWLVYTRDKFAPVGGCAKPVVYLYPEKTEDVVVRLGADVTVSDPAYEALNGWHVTASPDGGLKVNGVAYSSLYWEGLGHGDYPAITAGTIVHRAEAEATIRSQLAAQGLTAKEIQDFMTYWAPRIPNAPYIRLAWFTTAQINELAPLHVSPEPDTVIRVFLDMAGLQQPIELPQPVFNPIPRQGFTVVEWGGLSRQKLF